MLLNPDFLSVELDSGILELYSGFQILKENLSYSGFDKKKISELRFTLFEVRDTKLNTKRNEMAHSYQGVRYFGMCLAVMSPYSL